MKDAAHLKTRTPDVYFVIPGYYSESKEAFRQAANKWIRTSGSFDGVIDFDAVLRDPDHPSKLLPRFASPDHLQYCCSVGLDRRLSKRVERTVILW